jgi:hypothetical protein
MQLTAADGLFGKFPERRCTWRKLLNATKANKPATPQHAHHSAASTDTELTTIDTHDLWIQESEPTPCTMSALGQFGAEMLKLSRGLEAASHLGVSPKSGASPGRNMLKIRSELFSFDYYTPTAITLKIAVAAEKEIQLNRKPVAFSLLFLLARVY